MENFHKLAALCEELSERGSESRPTTERTFYAHCLLLKARLHAQSIVVLSDPRATDSPLLDVSAICVLARCLIEIRNVGSYLLERNISKDEAHLRLHLLALNHSVDALRIDRALHIDDQNMWASPAIEFARKKLTENRIFAALDPDHRKNLLRGKSPYQFSRYQGHRPLSASQEAGIYTLLSQSTHSYSLVLTSFAGFGDAAPSGRANSYRIAMLAAQIYLADFLQTYCTFRRRAIGRLTTEQATLITQASDIEPLKQALSRIRHGATS